MTFRESEYPQLFEELARLARRYPNPGLLREVFNEVLRVQQQVPCYPGIISSCVGQSVRMRTLTEIRPGEKLLLQTDDGEIFGEVKEVTATSVVLQQVVQESNTELVPKAKIKGIVGVVSGVLTQYRPDLVSTRE